MEDQMEDMVSEETEVVEHLEPQATGGSLKRSKKNDPIAQNYYGADFEKYMKIEEIQDLIPAYKDFFYQRKIKEPNLSSMRLVQAFNREVCKPMGRLFHPYPRNLANWKKKWEHDLILQARESKEEMKPGAPSIAQIVKTRSDEDALVAPDDGDIEKGIRTLGGELLNDAMQMLKDDQNLSEIHDADVLVKRRNYIVGVFGAVTKMAHGKAALMLKASEEKRANAGFLMDLLAKASSGTLSEEELGMLESSFNAPAVAAESTVPKANDQIV